MQLDLRGEQVSDKVNRPLNAQLSSGHSLVERVGYLERKQVGSGWSNVLVMPHPKNRQSLVSVLLPHQPLEGKAGVYNHEAAQAIPSNWASWP